MLPMAGGFWQDRTNQRQFLTEAGRRLGVKEVKSTSLSIQQETDWVVKMSDWYNITQAQIRREGGEGLFSYYNSLSAALMAAFPDFEWESTKFVQSRSRRTTTQSVTPTFQKLIFEEDICRVEAQLGINDVREYVCSFLVLFFSMLSAHCIMKPQDWFSIAHEDLAQCGLHLRSKMELQDLLKRRYPHLDWTALSLWRGRFGEQRILERTVRSLFEVQTFESIPYAHTHSPPLSLPTHILPCAPPQPDTA
jgi:hypothetical protein